MQDNHDTYIPQGLLDIIELIGEEKAIALVTAFGGVPWYIPQSPTSSHVFLKLLNYDELQKICDVYAGTYLKMPVGDTAGKKKPKILACIRKGMTIRDTALACKCTSRYVEMLRQEYSNALPQKSLLDFV